MKSVIIKQLTPVLLLIILTIAAATAQDTLRVPHVHAILYTGPQANQPLVVGLGGSEGGNAWAGSHWQKVRNQFIQKGYAFLAIGYFGCPGTPDLLNRIAIENVYSAIAAAKKHPKVDSSAVAVIGGSRGADLALLLGSYYSDVALVVGMSASNAVFPGHTQEFTNSCFTFAGKDLPFVPVNEAAVPFLIKRNLRGAFEAMLKDTLAEQQSQIQVEKIHGPVLLLSGTRDQMIPAVEMGEKMMLR
jgi:pimeloyl-ACP methyl ester carboxylesterase